MGLTGRRGSSGLPGTRGATVNAEMYFNFDFDLIPRRISKKFLTLENFTKFFRL